MICYIILRCTTAFRSDRPVITLMTTILKVGLCSTKASVAAPLHSGSKWLKSTEIKFGFKWLKSVEIKFLHLMLFHEFFKSSFFRIT